MWAGTVMSVVTLWSGVREDLNFFVQSPRDELLRIQRGLVAIVVIWNRFELKALADYSFRLSRSRSFCRCAAK